jgi:hypothetical protein
VADDGVAVHGGAEGLSVVTRPSGLDLANLAPWHLAVLAAVVAAAGFLHGVIGFGFPIIAMPVLTAVFDAKTAVLLTVVPIIAITLVSSFRGGNLRQSIGRFWWLPLVAAAGGFLGVQLFLVAPVQAITVLLAALIVVYLLLDRFGPGRFPLVHRHWIAFGAAAALLAGTSEASVNVGVPPLLIYFMMAGVDPLAMVQSLNFIFLASKLVQAATLIATGTLPAATAAALLPFAAIAVGTLYAGMRVRDRLAVATYRRALRVFLWIAVVVLLARVAWERIGS